MPLNQILYGPPGTGKTYRTRRLAVAIIDGEDKVKRYKDEKLKKRYEELRTEGRIVFTTFHQSLGYEEFVEGIKPKIQDAAGSSDDDEPPAQEARDQIQYEIQDGIFKTIAERALQNASFAPKHVEHSEGALAERALQDTLSILHKKLLDKKPKVWRISLGRTKGEVKQECFENDRIATYWDYGDLSDEEVHKEYQRKNPDPSIDAFNEMRIDDLFFVYQNGSRNQAGAAAVGVIKGNYEYDTEPKIVKYSKYTGKVDEYKNTRKVKWCWRQSNEDEYIDLYDLNNNSSLPNRTCHETKISARDLLQRTQEKLIGNNANSPNEDRPKYVLIIDEINRGNISKILGELITLIEDNKRLGNEEAMKVKLPYSGDDFGVPNNLYIIGTMNTADRSIAFLDTALRRRFSFIEMMPDYDVLAKELKPIAGINIPQMLKAMNEQIIEQHDRDHQIGHSYFLRLKKSPELNVLAEIFKHEIIPLLREYFYNDAAQIEKVLNGKEFLNEGDDLDKALQKATHYQNIYKSSPNP